jgi:flagellar basal-body rod protein FlgF
MNNGLYSAFLGMRARQRTLDMVANNIANASTSGFKADRALYRSIEAAEVEAQRVLAKAGLAQDTTNQTARPQPTPTEETNQMLANDRRRAFGVLTNTATDFSSGVIKQTDRSLDIAISGEGFLAVQTLRGERYTRAGSLSLDGNGQLVTAQGDLVVGDGGPITLPPGEITIGDDGTISVEGETVGRLKIVEFTNTATSLTKEGNSLFVASQGSNPVEATQATVIQGALETSNVNPMLEMATMMQNNREFDSLQKSITLMREIGRRVVTELGKL